MQAVGPIQSPMQRVLGTFVEEEVDHSSLTSAELKMHESTLVFPYVLMACGMVLNITQGHTIQNRGTEVPIQFSVNFRLWQFVKVFC